MSDPASQSRSTVTVTFLFTDIEGSVRLWQDKPTMADALARHDAILRQHIERHGGTIFKTVGDGVYAHFPIAPRALAAALDAQNELVTLFGDEPDEMPLRVRMALHTGDAEPRDGDFYGTTPNRAARLLGTLHGGQIGLSEATALMVRETALPPGVLLRDLGLVRLRDLEHTERLYQVVHPDLPADFPPPRSLDTLPNNLPRQLTSFIGRERERAEAKRLLGGTPLLTIIGPGGSGKTRLALQVAESVLDQHADGVWFIDLAPLTDPALIPHAVAATLRLREEAQQALTETVYQQLRPKRLLLILDNCEHLIDAAAVFAETLLRRCPEIKVIATSREALGITGETAWPLPTLTLPADPAHSVSLAHLARFESIRLFAERAAAVSPSFALNPDNAAGVARICRALDGIPLAIELAAGWTNVLSLEQVETRLGDRFRFLKGGSRTALPRQQTLRAAIDWSYDLLSEPERVLLRRLSVFAGGCTLEAAEAVCADDVLADFEVLDALFRLVRKSLVVKEEARGEARYRLLDTIRHYGHDRLKESGETEAVKARHQQFFTAFAEKAEPELRGPEQQQWLNALEDEHDNFRAALAYLPEHGLRMRLASALYQFWFTRGYASQGRRWIQEVIGASDATEPSPLLARLYNRAGVLAMSEGDRETAKAQMTESAVISRALGDATGIAIAQTNLAIVATQQSDYETARVCYEESAAIYRQSGDTARLSALLNNLAATTSQQKDHAAAQRYLEEALALYREQGDLLGTANSLHNLAQSARDAGRLGDACAYIQESLALRRQINDRSNLAMAFTLLAMILTRSQQWQEAALLFGAAEQAHHLLNTPLVPVTRAAFDKYLTETRQALPDRVFAEWWQRGQKMEMEEAINFALELKIGLHASQE